MSQPEPQGTAASQWLPGRRRVGVKLSPINETIWQSLQSGGAARSEIVQVQINDVEKLTRAAEIRSNGIATEREDFFVPIGH